MIDLNRIDGLIVRPRSPEFSGVIEIRLNGSVILANAVGAANRAEDIPNRMDTRFGIASGTKTFTAAAICRLVDDGLLALEAPLREYLEPYPRQWDPEVTVHHLLSHQSGLPDYYDEETVPDEAFAKLWLERPCYTIRRPADLLPLFVDQPMKHSVGERFHYNNGGYILLGHIIEVLTGSAYTQYVENNVFARVGMTDSGYFEMDRLPGRTAYGYVRDAEGAYHTNFFSVPVIGLSDGGVFTTAGDVARFWDALLSHRLLRPETTELMVSPHADISEDRAYGYGLWLFRHNAVWTYHAMGGDPGVVFHSRFFPADAVLVTLLGNTEDPSDDVWRDVIDAVLENLV